MFVPLRSSHSHPQGGAEPPAPVGSRPYLCTPQESSDFRSIPLREKTFFTATIFIKQSYYKKRRAPVCDGSTRRASFEESAQKDLRDNVGSAHRISFHKKEKGTLYHAGERPFAMAPHDVRFLRRSLKKT
ncbi:hypothetical protein LQ50_23665 [Halalkalibacter okhensis]|uniref:Uncharacterized protein n=1 Tax=Halalkalibacter okhensis TaxID=333138 RepID=A0A0B0IB13_9BACI|nr:hypothetical protein LQ50_23665 [Halalkalibacter okhensis]